jgi:hypothetical protein
MTAGLVGWPSSSGEEPGVLAVYAISAAVMPAGQPRRMTSSSSPSFFFLLSIPKTLSGVLRARGARVWQHQIVDATDASDGFRMDSALNSDRRADRVP